MGTRWEDIPSWVICPECLDALEGQIGEPCIICGTPLQATPLSAVITAKVTRPQYTPEEQAIIDELGL